MRYPSYFKIMFVDDAEWAMVSMEEVKAYYQRLVVEAQPDLSECIRKIGRSVRTQDLLWLNYHYFEHIFMAFPNADRFSSVKIFFASVPGISGIAVDIIAIGDVTPRIPRIVFAHPYASVVSGFVGGIELKRRPGSFIEQLLEQIGYLNILKPIFPATRDYPNLVELVDSCFKKLLECLNAKSGILRVHETKSRKPILFEEYGPKSLNDPINHLLLSHDGKIVVRNVSGDSGEAWELEHRSHGVRKIISGSIRSKSCDGGLVITSGSEEVGKSEISLLEVFIQQLGVFLDNTVYCENLFHILNGRTSLVEPREDAMMTIDSGKRVVDLNRAAEALTGWRKEEALGKHCSELWHSCDYFGMPMCNTAQCPMEKVFGLHQCVQGREVRIVTKTGQRRIVTSDYLVQFGDKAEAGSGIATVRDVTSRITLQERLHRLEQMARLGDFASELAHEIRNPVTGISSSAQYLYESPEIKEDYKRIIEEILIGAHTLERTVRKYLDMARSAKPNLRGCKLQDIIQEVVKFLEHRMEEQNISVITDYAEDLPEIFVDADQIKQVYVNVILNAIEAMPDGGRVSIKTCLEARAGTKDSSQAKRIVSTICDTGHGIPAFDTEKIFEAFYSTKPSGSGLGLHTSYKILERHGADIILSSEVGTGSRVTISFPLVKTFNEIAECEKNEKDLPAKTAGNKTDRPS